MHLHACRLVQAHRSLYERRATLGLTPEQQRLLERLHLEFVRAGAKLEGKRSGRYAR